MSVLDEDEIDSMVMGEDNELILMIDDHIPWVEEEMETHLMYLQRKVNAYLVFIQSGEGEEVFPDEDIQRYVLEIVLTHNPPKDALKLFAEVQRVVSEVNTSLRIVMVN